MKTSSNSISLLLAVSISSILMLPVSDVYAQHRYIVKIKHTKKIKENTIKFNSERATPRASTIAPVNSVQHGILKSFSSIAYGIPYTPPDGNTEMAKPILVEPTIDADLFMRYVDTLDHDYLGIRVFPGLTASNMIFPIICLANRNNSSERNFIILDKFNYDQTSPLPLPVDSSIAGPYLRRFKTTVRAFDKLYTQNKFNLTRYYPQDTLAFYFNENILTRPYSNYKVKIEIGYVPEALSEEFDRLVKVEDISQHVGFTVMFHIIEPSGMPVIYPFGPENIYKGRHLEVGSPCPPLCGELVPLGP